MFELPEYVILSQQINQTLVGKTVKTGNYGNSPHKFVWHNIPEAEFAHIVNGRNIGTSFVRGRWLFVPLEPDYTLLFGECGGKFLYHQAASKLPAKFHFYLEFEDNSFITLTTQMWGAMELYEGNSVWERQYIKGMRLTPLDEGFTSNYFLKLIEEVSAGKKTSAKALLTQDQLVPGLGNSIAQDILFTARVHPRQDVSALDTKARQFLFISILKTIDDIIQSGGRNDEVDLFGNFGGYVRIMDKNAAGNPCPICRAVVEKMAYLGGACYFCPQCQILRA